MLLYSDFEVISSSQDGWSPARVRAADAEYRAYRRATRQAALEEKPAWAKHYEGPEPGATKEDLRVYTEVDGEYRYWGVRDLNEMIEEFGARKDLDNITQRIAKQDSNTLPALAKLTPAERPSPRPHTASRSKRRQETPEVARRRVTKPAIVTPASNKRSKDLKIDEQIQDVANRSTKEPTVVPCPCGGGWPDGAERPQTISGVNSSASHQSTTKSTVRGRPRKVQWGFVDSSSSNPTN